ncbi:isochorismate synthase [Arthrobacter sp. 35W]|uniref:isochorismate synthase n=1 Tax=Arthrobacter sp. 35W TaxID=1132441 RepID=UPI000415FF5F|nr:isochorismate synthase [Arthrobacter sp. 35W]
MTASLTTLTTALDPAMLAEIPAGLPAHLPAGFPNARPAGGLAGFLDIPGALCWIRRGEGLVAFGEVARFTGHGPTRFSDAEDWWKALLAAGAATGRVVDHIRMPGTGPLAFGSFAFSKTSAYDSTLIVPRLVLGLREGTVWLTQLSMDGTLPTAGSAHRELAALLAGALTADAGAAPALAGPAAASISMNGNDPHLATGSLTEQEWMDSVSAGVAAIATSGLEKVVLARDVVATLDSPISRGAILRTLADRYSECWTYGVGSLVGATPEMLIKVEGSRAQARVLAGTLDRQDEPDGATAFASEVLGGSAKQRQEHDFAVRSLTRQLAPFATDLSVPSEPFILELPNVWHLASDVSAELAGTGTHMPTSLALVEALHPTAAVCGTPREAAGELILELEKMDRGPYAGPVGWLDGAGNGEWGIALRGAVVEDPVTVRLYAGAGIVEASDPAAELAETWAKFRPMLQALGLHT